MNVVVVMEIMNVMMQNQNFVPNLSPKVFLAMKNCIAHVANCTQRLVNAAPFASKIGMKIKFNVRFIMTPTAATMLSCSKFPLAVNNVPKIYVIEIDTKLPIKICNIRADSKILML